MSWEGIYLIQVSEWFGNCYRCSTIEQVDNRTGTGRVFLPTLNVCSRSRKVDVDYLPLDWSVFIADTSQSYYCEWGLRWMHIHYIIFSLSLIISSCYGRLKTFSYHWNFDGFYFLASDFLASFPYPIYYSVACFIFIYL